MTPAEVADLMRQMDTHWGAKFKMDEDRVAAWCVILAGFHARDVQRAFDRFCATATVEELAWPPALAQLILMTQPLHRKREQARAYNQARLERFQAEGDEAQAARAEEALRSWD